MTMRLATWLTSTPHRIRADEGDSWVWRPYGVHHGRRLGTVQTACGMPAFHWHVFYDLPFQPSGTSACADCAAALLALDDSRTNDPLNSPPVVSDRTERS